MKSIYSQALFPLLLIKSSVHITAMTTYIMYIFIQKQNN